MAEEVSGDEKKVVENRLGNCEVCGGNAQYTCPRCELKTCSLDCIKIHKKELECTGERDKTGYVPLSKFTNLNLLSDYRFLEDASRTIDNCRRNPLMKFTRYKKMLPPHLQKLRKAALSRKTTIQYLPQHFTRHKENTTYLHFDTRIIFWRLEFIFPQGDHVRTVVEKCDENERLSTVLSKFVEFDNCPDLYKKSLKFYHSAGISALEVLLKAEYVQKQPSFFLLDLSSTLKENFENRIIVEYPVLYVIHRSHKDEYTILDSDMEIDLKARVNFRKRPDFTPFNYFDTVSYKPSKGSEAMQLINSSAAELRKYFCADGESDEEKEAPVQVEKQKEKAAFRKKSFPKVGKLNIPTYDNLINQNS